VVHCAMNDRENKQAVRPAGPVAAAAIACSASSAQHMPDCKMLENQESLVNSALGARNAARTPGQRAAARHALATNFIG